MTYFMVFQLSLLLRRHYYCHLSKSTSAPVGSSLCLPASVFPYDLPPSPSRRILLHRHLCCFPTASGQVITPPPPPPPPQLFSKHVGDASIKSSETFQRWKHDGPHSNLWVRRKENTFKSGKGTENITDQKKKTHKDGASVIITAPHIKYVFLKTEQKLI